MLMSMNNMMMKGKAEEQESNLVLHYDTSVISSVHTVTSGEIYVNKLDDISGFGRDLKYPPSNITKRFKYGTGIYTLNGINTIDGRAGSYLYTDNFGILYPQPTTWIVITRINNLGTNYHIDGINAVNRQVCGVKNLEKNWMYGGNTLYKAGASYGWAIRVYIFNGINSKMIIDNVITSNNAGTNGIDGVTLGNNYALTGDTIFALAEAKLFNKVLSNLEINQKCNELATKWGLTWTDI